MTEDPVYPSQTRALRKKRIQPLSSPDPAGSHEFWTARNTLSGWGIRIVARPSVLVSPVTPPG